MTSESIATFDSAHGWPPALVVVVAAEVVVILVVSAHSRQAVVFVSWTVRVIAKRQEETELPPWSSK